MKPDKAIEILIQMTKDTNPLGLFDMVDALKLGVEALKFYSELKRTQGVKITFNLPGETPPDAPVGRMESPYPPTK